jgi:serine phosphatase RsbU (regulator of sigma subunit)
LSNRINSNTETTADITDDYLEKITKYEIFRQEANHVREKDKKLIRDLFKSFSHRDLLVGIGFQRAYGSIISGDYFDLFKLSDNNFLFVFADISGHGLPAYTTLIRLRSAVILAVKEMEGIHERTGIIDMRTLLKVSQ